LLSSGLEFIVRACLFSAHLHRKTVAPTPLETARYWRSPLLPGAELLTARFLDYRFAPHWHDAFVVAVIERGAERYHHRGTRRVAGAGTIAPVNPGEVHTGERAVEEGWAYRVFYPSVEWMEGVATGLAGRLTGVPWLPEQVIADREVAARLARAHRLLEAGAGSLAAETALTGAFSLLVSRHCRNAPRAAALRGDDARVRTMRERLAERLEEPLTLSRLAAEVGLSPFHAARLFSRSVGMPPHAWRNQLRLARAAGLLRRGISPGEAAASCGFFDQSHLTRIFRRAYGVPPGRWRAA
jgi:AraC-like DNA-binding protein